MIRKILCLLAFALPLFSQEKVESVYENLIREISQKYVPDKRVDVFEVVIYRQGDALISKGETTVEKAKAELILKLKQLSPNVVDSIIVLPSPELGNKIYGVVSVSVANMRSKPMHQAELVNQVLMGSNVKILKRHGYWYFVQTEPPESYLGWVEEEGLKIFNLSEFEEWKRIKKIIFVDYFGFVYSQKDKKSIPVSDLVMGDVLGVEKYEGEWVGVVLPDGRRGYVEKAQIDDLEKWRKSLSLSTSSIINTAKKFVGFPYLWGGTSVKGFDCSGFTKIVFKINGFELPRDADQQSRLGVEIDPGKDFENLKPGDLLFFGQKSEDGKPEKITHVGIYLGNKEFIHCSGKVSIDSFDPKAPNFNEYRYKTFVKAKRLIEK
ncbi:NlpC/P60 family protein [Candidatus Kryptonium thompsonii]|uniref:NlpC/P60 family protein n=1 Tax=Candidatus Kryptonium thompsonii TaxID=1633631 RepID=A0A0N7MZ46_9BACT|nr:C40 family peptidase [Candidatus Kryptonium thompsoni]CUS76450.1 NlpC/P60 family protein [Candidatus Kryptonium thompsoni]CUS83111.1 NlpC/P60 family protein [Candidatus Kryptonium thompsoni]CUS84099.1 NlpC/P60 family protein [Candidatus Kryptonium thompsoni]CUS93902.1 NlpC/P60 family protein [Candidatus Kryptonium thompsoni]CUS94855.1 NlpC/P60 family protein [Candidatus Kryptonium thompsoni]